MFLCIVMDKSVKKLNNPWYLDGFVLPERFSSSDQLSAPYKQPVIMFGWVIIY